MPYRRVLAVIALALLLTLAACGDPPNSNLPPVQIVNNTGAKMLALKSYHIELTIKTTTGDSDAKLSGDIVTPDKGHLTLTQQGNSRELLILGPSESYQRSGDAWMIIPRAGVVLTSFNSLWSDQSKVTAKQVEDLGREDVGGVSTRHLKLKNVKVNTRLVGTEEIWVYEGDFTTRRLMTYGDIGVGSTRTTVDFSNLDSVAALPGADKLVTATPPPK